MFLENTVVAKAPGGDIRWHTEYAQRCSYIEGSLSLSKAETLDLDFSCLQEIEGSISIEETDFSDFESFPNLQYAEAINLRDNYNFPNSYIFPSLESVGSLDIGSNNIANSFDYFHGLKEAESISIHEKDIIEIRGFSNLKTIKKELHIGNAYNLQSILGLSNLVECSGLPDIPYEIDDNCSIQIANNDSLTSIDLGSLEIVNGDLRIQENHLITFLNLDSLEEIQGRLYLENTSLFRLGLDNFKYSKHGGSIIHNHNLCETEVDELISQIEGGSFVTVGNGGSCVE